MEKFTKTVSEAILSLPPSPFIAGEQMAALVKIKKPKDPKVLRVDSEVELSSVTIVVPKKAQLQGI